MRVNMDIFEYNKYFIAVVVIVITILIIFLRQKKKSRRAVLFTGLCNTGKTLLFTRLVHGKCAKTYTSIKENVGEIDVNGKSLRIIDIPGHERVRNKFLDNYKSEALAVVYLIDSSVVHQEVRDVAEYLYNILNDPILTKNKLNVLIVCNKQEVDTSNDSTVVKTLLEKELTTLQITKSNQLDSVDSNTNKSKRLLLDGDKFDFSLLTSTKVEFTEILGNKEPESIKVEGFIKWFSKIA